MLPSSAPVTNNLCPNCNTVVISDECTLRNKVSLTNNEPHSCFNFLAFLINKSSSHEMQFCLPTHLLAFLELISNLDIGAFNLIQIQASTVMHCHQTGLNNNLVN